MVHVDSDTSNQGRPISKVYITGETGVLIEVGPQLITTTRTTASKPRDWKDLKDWSACNYMYMPFN